MGPLSSHLEVLAGRPQPRDALLGGVLGEALGTARLIDELFFCTEELLPLLRTLGGTPVPRRSASARTRVPQSTELAARAANLREAVERLIPQLDAADDLAERLGLPCAVINRDVIPLERVDEATPPEDGATIEGVHYRLRPEESRPLSELLRASRLEVGHRARQLLTADPGLTKLAAGFLDDARAVVDRCQPKRRTRYQLVHRDPDHQLHHAQGHWILVRGPVARRFGSGSVYVGLPIRGTTREERLRMGPHPSPTLAGLWTPRGVPARGGLCMGGGGQYRRLLSTRFSEAEAVVQWLDAGVILATGRSDFHREWRKHGKKRAAARMRGL
jgi:hypothetical protein